MKCQIVDKYLAFIEFTHEELAWVKHKLTWENPRNNEVQTLFFYNSKNQPYTLYGLYEPLREICPFPIDLNSVEDAKTNIAPCIDPHFLIGLKLFDFQCESIQRALVFKKGIISSPTGSGKTEQILGVLNYVLNNHLIKKGLIVVPSVGLAQQFYERALLRGFKPDEISILCGGTAAKNTILVIGVINSVDTALNEVDHALHTFIKTTDLIILDEAHHGSSSRYRNLILKTKPTYLLYYSASPFRSKILWESYTDCLLLGLAGKIIYRIPQKTVRSLGLIAEPIIFFKTIPGKISKQRARYNEVYDTHIVNHPERNKAIAQYASKFARLNFPVLILVQRIEHARILMRLLKDFEIITVLGGSTSLQFNEFKQIEEVKIDYNHFRSEFEKASYQIVIASQVMDEGFDIPAIGSVILAGGGKSKIQQLQRLGRGLRRKKVGRNCVYIVDFYDKSHVFLFNQSKRRIELFRELEATFPQYELEFIENIIKHSLELKK